MHDIRRERPSQAEHRLREACRQCGLQILGYEVEAYDEEANEGRSGAQWYDGAIQAYGATVYLDAAENWSTKRLEKRIREKVNYCKRRGIPYFRIKQGSSVEMRARIESSLIQLAARRAI